MPYFQLDSGVLQQYGRPATPEVTKDPFGSAVAGFQVGQNIALKSAANRRAEEQVEMDKQEIATRAEQEAYERTQDAVIQERANAVEERAKEKREYEIEQRDVVEADKKRAAALVDQNIALTNLRISYQQTLNDGKKESGSSGKAVADLEVELAQMKASGASKDEIDAKRIDIVATSGDVMTSEARIAQMAMIGESSNPEAAAGIRARRVNLMFNAVYEDDDKTFKAEAASIIGGGARAEDIMSVKVIKGNDTPDNRADDVVEVKSKNPDGTTKTTPIDYGNYIKDMEGGVAMAQLYAGELKSKRNTANIKLQSDHRAALLDWKTNRSDVFAGIKSAEKEVTDKQMGVLKFNVKQLAPELAKAWAGDELAELAHYTNIGQNAAINLYVNKMPPEDARRAAVKEYVERHTVENASLWSSGDVVSTPQLDKDKVDLSTPPVPRLGDTTTLEGVDTSIDTAGMANRWGGSTDATTRAEGQGEVDLALSIDVAEKEKAYQATMSKEEKYLFNKLPPLDKAKEVAARLRKDGETDAVISNVLRSLGLMK